jgi:hypothetical protein
MKVLIHACPKRMWYVEGFLVPELERQGADKIEVWNDTEGKGNLRACMEAFAAQSGEDGTWHIQDDVLLCRDFVERCRQHDEGVVYGFCNEAFTDDPLQTGHVNVEDAWHSFQCVRIPDAYARECAAWLEGPGKTSGMYSIWIQSGKMDDDVFRTFLIDRHGRENVLNLKPNLVEHVDWIVGGSVLHPWRGYIARAHFWDDEDLVRELKEAVKGKVQYAY